MELNFILGITASLATIASGSLAVGKYLGRAGVIEEAANRLGVDIAELVIPEPGEDIGSPHTEEGNQRVNFLLEHFYPPEFEEALRRWANEPGDGYDTTDLVYLARSEVAPGAVIEIALEPEGANRRAELLGQHLTDGELGTLLDERSLWPDPIKQVAQLEDDPGNAYAWILSGEATEEDRVSLRNEIEKTFIELNHAEPDSLHFIVANIDEIRELDSATVENYVKPWLKDSTSNEEENK